MRFLNIVTVGGQHMAYRGKVRTIRKIGNGEYFTQSMDLSFFVFSKILYFPFKLIWWGIKYTIGLPFVIFRKKR